jgi:DNA-binding MarR family transcriptional regulator
MSDIWKHSQARGADLLVLLALGDFANDERESFPSLKVLADKARLSVRGACKVLDKLERAGEIRRQRSSGGKNRRTRYFITTTNSERGSLNTIQRTPFSERGDIQTVNPSSHAKNHHRTVNKTGAKAPLSSSISKGRKLTERRGDPDPAKLAAFDAFYVAYPRHVARQAAFMAWTKLNPSPELQASIMAGAARYAQQVKGTEPRFVLHPATWLNQERWTDEPTTVARSDRPRRDLAEIPAP